MQYLFDSNASVHSLIITAQSYKYLFKVRRHKVGELIACRNLKDNFIYFYKVENISKKEAILTLKDKRELIVKPLKYLHIGWCIIDPKSIEKTLPMLNEIGVSKISFIYCHRSQKNFKINFKRLEKILIGSSQQCGRSEIMQLEEVESLQNFFEIYPKSAIIDFGGKTLKNSLLPKSIVIGCEGGFSESERKLFVNRPIYKVDTPMILRSESAVVSISAMVLL